MDGGQLNYIADTGIPESLRPYAGRIVDTDAHEYMPAQVWVENFGPAAKRLADFFLSKAADGPNGFHFTNYADTMPITAETVWREKTPRAPGSTSLQRRLDVLDYTGVSRQFMFPSGVGIMGSFLFNFPPEYGFFSEFKGAEARKAYGKELMDAANQWAVRSTHFSDRLRPVAALYGNTPDALITETQRLLDQGIRAVWLMSSVPPGGVSPAHKDLDPLWAMLAERNISVTLHIGSEGNFLKTEVWGRAPAFEGYKVGAEFDMSPWRLSIQHLPSQNFLATMITGGVFERHPTLRFGVIELGAYWVGHLAETLDLWYDNGQNFGPTSGKTLPLRPSQYIARNVRVPAFPFEPVDQYIERYGLEDVYCYASDYPHPEGGKDAMARFARAMERLGPEIMEKFFVTNGAYLMPA
jgi:predicted TIM-barrel fold metal-dependent hydrolase